MPENSRIPGVTAGKKRKASTRLSSFARTTKQPKMEIPATVTPASAPQVKVGPGLGLCSYCNHIINERSQYAGSPTKDHWKEILENMNNSSCASCELIWNAMPINRLPGAREKPGFGALHPLLLRNWGFEKMRITDGDGLRLYGTLVSTKYNKRPMAIPEMIDFKAITAWLERCRKGHESGCGPRKLSLRHFKPINVILVDVIQDCLVIKTTASRYFALSYVWGDAITATTNTQNLLSLQKPGSLGNHLTLPKTVSDAMLITRNMDTRYLWVDCLSIIQDSQTKHHDFVNMDIIFSQAELTIVANSGTDANSGLPGVRQRTRRQRAMSNTQRQQTTILELPFSKNDLLFGTIYSSRGWTFQELLLSKRLLFVTDHQVVFHCDTSRCSETHPQEEIHDGGELGLGTVDLRSTGYSLRSMGDLMNSYTAMVIEYCTRRLTFETDIENAFSGLASILEAWCDGRPVVHGMLSSFFGHSMLWAFKEGQDYFGCHSVAERGKRREGFPSWSWVGWVGCTSNINHHMSVKLPLQSLMRNVEITTYGKRNAEPLSLNVLDESVKEENAVAAGQQLQINLEPATFNSNPAFPNTLGFDAERTEWKNFAVDILPDPSPVFLFSLSENSSVCGFLSIAPDEELSNTVFDQARQAVPRSDCDWSLIRLYHLRMRSWDNVKDDLQHLLYETESVGVYERGFAERFRRRLQRSNLLYVLLVRRRGLHWERIGSGLMFQRHWPSTSKQAKVRAYQERIVLI